MVGRGQAPEALPESGWVESLAADEGGESGQAPMEEAEPVVDDSATTDDAETEAEDPPPATFEDRVAEAEPVAEDQQPAAPAGLPADDPSLASGWVIQVKATADQTEARALQDELSRSGFPAFVVQDSSSAM